MTTQDKCSKKVWARGGYVGHQCRNDGKVVRDGKWYCGIHDPVAVKAKNDAYMNRLRAKCDASDKVRKEAKAKQAEIERRADCYPDLLAALQWFIEYDDTNIGQLGNEFFEAGLNAGIAAVAKATGEAPQAQSTPPAQPQSGIEWQVLQEDDGEI